MNDPAFNDLLKWGIQNSEASLSDPAAVPQPLSDAQRELLGSLFSGQPRESHAERMIKSLRAVRNKEGSLENQQIAFENFEMCIQNLDNANNMEVLMVNFPHKDDVKGEKSEEKIPAWTVLLEQLENEEDELRRWAAKSCGTIVQNNARTQERLLILGAIPTLVRMATGDPALEVRKAATTALSSEVRNFQPALDIALSHVPAEFKPEGRLDAADMDSVDLLIGKLRDDISKSVS